ncbi:MAG TPA: DUF308 domain-containing protein [Candidatus Ruthenibacterium avium]|uniref:DUF308 domain-containing protein n=1 Tax=Candidatus Ruthenibacterium avium TaxID=2838751 RepID=A0A9D2M5L2_9FIRM|nr:DUF308 domain-containing protein [Candidatus Ruthenibacterium avium]
MNFFWSRKATLQMAAVYMLLGVLLMLFPGWSGTLFCWCLAIGAFGYAAVQGWYVLKMRKQGYTAPLSIISGGFFAVIGCICLFRPQWVLSFLPIILGLVLLADGFGKMPLMIEEMRIQSPFRWTVAVSCIAPLAVGIFLLFQPFAVAKSVIFLFGLGLFVDGLFDAIFAWKQR